jgi:predicted ATPase
MLIRFSFENHKCFAGPAALCFVAGRGSDHPGHVREPPAPEGAAGASARGRLPPLLPVLGLYGANAAGKSVVLDAFRAMSQAVRRGLDADGAPARLRWSPHKLRDDTLRAPSTFDLEFVLGGVRYRYGFSITDRRVHREWLHAWTRGTQQVWFERDGVGPGGWYFGPVWRTLRHRAAAETPDDELFLSAAARRRHPEAVAIREVFGRWETAELAFDERVAFFASPLFDAAYRPLVLALLRGADLGVCDVRAVNMRKRVLAHLAPGPAEAPGVAAALDAAGEPRALQLGHVGAAGETIWLDPEDESDGTHTFIQHLHHILRALDSGGLLLVDEMDRALHPHLVAPLLRFFTDPAINRRGAQLVFTSHDTGLLAALRRDEVVLVEKGPAGASTLAPVSSFRSLKREDLERLYRDGRFGGVPWLAGLDATQAEWAHQGGAGGAAGAGRSGP